MKRDEVVQEARAPVCSGTPQPRLHGQGGDEPTAEPPANRVEVDAKQMVNEPVQQQVTTKTSVIHHGDVGNHNMLNARK